MPCIGAGDGRCNCGLKLRKKASFERPFEDIHQDIIHRSATTPVGSRSRLWSDSAHLAAPANLAGEQRARAWSEHSNVRISSGSLVKGRTKTVGFKDRNSVTEMTPRTIARDQRAVSEDIDGRLYNRISYRGRRSRGASSQRSENWRASGELSDAAFSALASLMSQEDDTAQEDLTKLQAIMTGLPRYALDAGKTCACLFCSGPEAHLQRVERGLEKAAAKFPDFADELRRMRIAYVDVDLTIFIDDAEQRLFTSIRGTSPDVCRDLYNDCFIAFGRPPPRLHHCRERYSEVRGNYPDYASYGCGHSLGGAVMHELAYGVEREPAFAFVRVDVFNAGGSPLRRRYTALSRTEFNAHRVQGDLVSAWYEPPVSGRKIEHEQRTSIGAHGLGHFLPREKKTLARTATEATVQVRTWFTSSLFSCWRLQLCRCLGNRPL